MTKTIDTLADDIKALLGDAARGTTTTVEEELLAKFGTSVALHVADRLRARYARKPNVLYMSEIGKPCKRQVWYGAHHPELAEKPQEHSLIKFLYGDILEEVLLLLAEAAGHTVEHRQKKVEWLVKDWAVRGRIDAVIDGVLVDVKSASPYAYKKFEGGLNDDNDDFGYRAQLSGYNALQDYERQGFLVIDKQNGHVGFFEQEVPRNSTAFSAMVETVKAIHNPDEAPPRAFADMPEGKSGNMKLCTNCSYCPFKQHCWSDANDGDGLRAFSYATGPAFLTEVKKHPKVPELILVPPGAEDEKLVPMTKTITIARPLHVLTPPYPPA